MRYRGRNPSREPRSLIIFHFLFVSFVVVMPTSSRVDIVVFGATGFTGGYVCRYLFQYIGNDPMITVAVAGRSSDKLNGSLFFRFNDGAYFVL
jgi:hypothetical protein